MDSMKTYQDALAALERLPQRTRDVEQAVHGHGVSVSLVAQALCITETEVQSHLQAARQARAGLAAAGCAGENEATRPTRLEQAIVMAGEGMRIADIAVALGCQTATVHVMLSRARSRGAKIPRAGTETRRVRTERVVAMTSAGLTPKAVASACGCKVRVVYRTLARARAEVDAPGAGTAG